MTGMAAASPTAGAGATGSAAGAGEGVGGLVGTPKGLVAFGERGGSTTVDEGGAASVWSGLMRGLEGTTSPGISPVFWGGEGFPTGTSVDMMEV